jgi:hypothetical protein
MVDLIETLISTLISWVSANAVWIGSISIMYFVVSLFAVRFLIIRIPPGYFMESGFVVNPAGGFRTTALKIGKNVCGLVVILIGLIMSIPGVAGQGFLTILLGLSLTDFPGKRTLELRIIRQPLIFRTIASIREKAGKPPLEIPGVEAPGDGSGPQEGESR